MILNEQISNLGSPVFTTQNLNAFRRKVRLAKTTAIRDTLLHKSLGRKRPDLAVLSDDDINFIKVQRTNQRNLTVRSIQDLLLKERGVFASPETIKKIWADKLTKNLLKNFSSGSSQVRKNNRPTIKRVVEYPGDQYQGDGSKLQFLCIDHTGKIITLFFYVVLDTYSGKVVGFSIDRSENSEMVKRAFQMSFTHVGYLPHEVLVDNGPSYKSREFKKFIRNLQMFGVTWRFCHKDYPLEKAEVESFFSTFQKVVCSKYPFYIGEGVKTKNVYGNPSAELNKKYYKQKWLLPEEKALKIQLFEMIKQYNDEYYKKVVESLNEVPGKREEKNDSIGAIHGVSAFLEQKANNS